MNDEKKSPWGILTGIRPAKIAMKLLTEGETDDEIIAYFTGVCGTTAQKAALVLETARQELPVKQAMYPDGISLYIGIPFCPTRCLYCSFVTCGTRQAAKLIPDYLACLNKEIAYAGALTARSGKRIETVYIGGTPTTLNAEQLSVMLSQIRDCFDLSHCREFTVEAGRPDTVTADKLNVLKQHRVSRISINPQSMNEKTLHIIGRAHTPAQIRDAVALARSCGFDNINMDVIAGLPGETPDDFRHTMEEVEALSPENTTVHTMSVKRSSRLHEYLDQYTLSDADTVEEMVDFAYAYLKTKGKHPYYLYRQKHQLGNLENVGYALPHKECLYNVCMMDDLSSVLALGAGAITKILTGSRIQRYPNPKDVKLYLERIDAIRGKYREILR